MGVTLAWPGGSATMEPLGGMVAPLRFTLPDGRQVEPLNIAPWAGEALPPDAPGILRGLRGDFPCLPFGTGDAGPLAPRWAGIPHAAAEPPHGAAANGMWEVAVTDGTLTARFAPPGDGPVAELVQRLVPDGPMAVACTLEVTVRRPCRLPLALHPIFRLSARPRGTRLDLHRHGPVFTHPTLSLADPSPLTPDAEAPGLAALPGRAGGACDFSHLPLPEPVESRLLVSDSAGRVSLHHAEGWSAHLEWDAAVLPNVMLWVSNGGRGAAPWLGRHVALGVEPCAAAFDLGTEASAGPNPLAARGVVTAVDMAPDRPLRLWHRIAVSAGE